MLESKHQHTEHKSLLADIRIGCSDGPSVSLVQCNYPATPLNQVIQSNIYNVRTFCESTSLRVILNHLCASLVGWKPFFAAKLSKKSR